MSQVGPGCWGAGEPQEPGGTGATVEGMGVSYVPLALDSSIPSSWEPSPHLARETGVGVNSPGRARAEAEAEGTGAEQASGH